MQIRPATLEEIAALEAEIPEFPKRYSLEQLKLRVSGRKHLALLALLDERPAGYKLGYEQTHQIFYSWVGGVVPGARRRGIARALLHQQEAWCRQQGYAEIQVKSENRYRSMLIMLLSEGYDIQGVNLKGFITLGKQL